MLKYCRWGTLACDTCLSDGQYIRQSSYTGVGYIGVGKTGYCGGLPFLSLRDHDVLVFYLLTISHLATAYNI